MHSAQQSHFVGENIDTAVAKQRDAHAAGPSKAEPSHNADHQNADEYLYLSAWEETTSGNINKALWIKCLALEQGDKKQARFRYIRLRVSQMKDRVNNDKTHSDPKTERNQP